MNTTQPMVVIYCDIVNETSQDSEKTIELQLSTENSRSPSPPRLTPIMANSPSSTEYDPLDISLPPTMATPPSFLAYDSIAASPKDDNTRKEIYNSIKTRYIHDNDGVQKSVSAMIDLNQGRLTIDAINAPRETIRTFLKRHMPLPIPVGDKNMLNKRFNMTMTLLHRSVKELKYDIVDLLLNYGADVNILEDGKSIAHKAAETNDTMLCHIIRRYKGDFSALDINGETPLMIAIALGNKETIKAIWKFTPLKISSTNNETVLHYAARHHNLKFVKEGCKIKNEINIHQKSLSEQYTALHIAVQQANVGATRVLLANGALDEWKDRYGKRARNYISDDAIRKLFRQYHMLPDKKLVKSPNNAKRTRLEPPRETTLSPQPGPSTAEISSSTNNPRLSPPTDVYALTTANERQNDAVQTFYLPVVKYIFRDAAANQIRSSRQINDAETEKDIHLPLPRQIDDAALSLYNPQKWNDDIPQQSEFFGFESEECWNEGTPIEQPIPNNYNKPQLEQSAPKYVYYMLEPDDYKVHLMHLNNQYSQRLRIAKNPIYKRDLYEIYVWERFNIGCALDEYKRGLMNNLLINSLPNEIVRFGPSC